MWKSVTGTIQTDGNKYQLVEDGNTLPLIDFDSLLEYSNYQGFLDAISEGELQLGDFCTLASKVKKVRQIDLDNA